MTSPAVSQPIITPAPEIAARQDTNGELIGYASMGSTWSPVYCKPGKRVFSEAPHVFGCFSTTPDPISDTIYTRCGCDNTISCWLITMYTATDDRDPLTGTGCSTPAYNGKVFQTTTAMGITSIPSGVSSTQTSEQVSSQHLSKGELVGTILGCISASATILGVWITWRYRHRHRGR